MNHSMLMTSLKVNPMLIVHLKYVKEFLKISRCHYDFQGKKNLFELHEEKEARVLHVDEINDILNLSNQHLVPSQIFEVAWVGILNIKKRLGIKF